MHLAQDIAGDEEIYQLVEGMAELSVEDCRSEIFVS
jgi:hypothetical protein